MIIIVQKTVMAIVTSHFCCVFSKTTDKYGIAFDNFNQSIVNSARPNDQVVGCILEQLKTENEELADFSIGIFKGVTVAPTPFLLIQVEN